jgi:PHD/YefM family antitoxin component YafN of YafNO toxin-antitoxin module
MYDFAYISNQEGEQVAVVVPIEEFKKMSELLEEYDDIQEYKKAKDADLGSVSFDEAFSELED